MKIKINRVNRVSLDEFARVNDLTMEVHERIKVPDDSPLRYFAYFKNTEVKDCSDDHFLLNPCGDGATWDAAVIDYATKIQGKLLVVLHAEDPQKHREILVPMLIPTWTNEFQ